MLPQSASPPPHDYGPHPHETLEKEWANYVDPHQESADPRGVVACSSGTAALHLALEALRLPAGGIVLVPDFSMIACARAVSLAGLTPVLVDCDPTTLNMDPAALALAVNELRHEYYRRSIPPGVGPHITVLVVHTYGRHADVTALRRAVMDPELLYWVEDLAEAPRGGPHRQSDAACWSFYKNKIVAGEEGGTVWFHRTHVRAAARARQLRCLGFTDAHDFNHLPRGHNYRMSSAHAKLVLDNLRLHRAGPVTLRNGDSYPSLLTARQQIIDWYDAHCPEPWKMPPRNEPWVYDLLLPHVTGWSYSSLSTKEQRLGSRLQVDSVSCDISQGQSRLQDRCVAALRKGGIAARHGFKPVHIQPEYKDCRLFTRGLKTAGCYPDCSPVTDAPAYYRWFREYTSHALERSRRVIYLPVLPGEVTETTARRAFEILHNTVEGITR